jgi:hypothetical protein
LQRDSALDVRQLRTQLVAIENLIAPHPRIPRSNPSTGRLFYPALYLYPLNDSFIPKHIPLLHNQRVQVGRQVNAKTAPGERNGYFDSKVLNRLHAEVWEDSGKVCAYQFH